MRELTEKIENLAKRIEANNMWRQRKCINLIPSETTPSTLVKLCEISDPSGRYAEHRTMKGKEIYYLLVVRSRTAVITIEMAAVRGMLCERQA